MNDTTNLTENNNLQTESKEEMQLEVKTKGKKDKNKKTKVRTPEEIKKIIYLCLRIFTIIFLIMSFVRVPYVGAFFDATIFSILFGYTKYFAYIFLLIILIYPKILKNQKIFNWKNISFALLIWFMICVSISAIGLQVNYKILNGEFNNFQDFFIGKPDSYFEYWKQNDWGHITQSHGTTWFYLNPKSYGGILSFVFVVLFEALAPITLAIITISCILVLLYFKISKLINKQVEKNKKENNNISYSKSVDNYVDFINKKSLPIPVNFSKQENQFDNLDELNSQFDELNKNIVQIFDVLNIDYIIEFKEIMYKSIVITYLLKNQYDKDNLKYHLNSKITDSNISFYFDNDKLTIIDKVQNQSFIPITSLISEISKNDNFKVSIGKNQARKFVKLDLLKNPNTLICASQRSDNIILLSGILISLMCSNNEKLLEFNILDLSAKKSLSTFSELKQIKNIVLENEKVINYLDNVIEIIDRRKELCSKNSCNDIYEYAVKNKQLFKASVVAINEIEHLESMSNNKLIQSKLKYILENSNKYGIITLVTSSNINQFVLSFKNNFNNIISFRLDKESDSIELLNTSKAKHLVGFGDGLLLTDKITHFQLFFMNKDDQLEIMSKLK